MITISNLAVKSADSIGMGGGGATRGHSFMVLCRALEMQSLHFKGGFPEWKQDIGW